MWIKTKGRVRSGKSLKVFDKDRPFWLVLECPKSIMWYHLNQVNTTMGAGYAGPPLAGSHISIVRRERPMKDMWDKIQGRMIQFEYQPLVVTHSKSRHWWLPVRGIGLRSLRKQMGLREAPYVPFHLTVGCDSEVLPARKKRTTKEVHSRMAVLEKMKEALPLSVWEASLEKIELATFKERYVL